MQGGEAHEALYLLASFLPRKSVHKFARSSLSSLSSSSDRGGHLALLIGLVSWGMGKEVVEVVREGLSFGLEEGEREDQEKGRTRKRRKMSVSSTPRPLLAVSILDSLMVCVYCVVCFSLPHHLFLLLLLFFPLSPIHSSMRR